MQRYSPFGRIKVSNVPKKHFHHWINKLIGAGWMRREGDYYVLISNERVWELLKIKKVNYKKRNCFYWRKLPEFYNTWSEFKKKIIEDIQGWQTENKKRQLLRRLSSSAGNTQQVSLFSGAAAAKLFGYRSEASGSKYRSKFFDLVAEPLRIRQHETSDGLPYWKADCKKIYLNRIFH